MGDRAFILANISLLRHENCQMLMLLLNKYWSRAALQNAALDFRQFLEMCKIIQKHASTILRICPARPEEVQCQKRFNQYDHREESKRRRTDGSSKNIYV